METFIFIENEKLKIPSTTKLIKAKNYTSISEADDLLINVRTQCEKILEAAQGEAENIKKAAERAFIAEKERGYNEGVENNRQDLATKISSVTINTEKYLNEVEKRITDIVLNTVRKVVEGMEPGSFISALVKKSLIVMRNHKHIKLKVSPVHLDYLNDRITEIIESFPNIQGIEIVGDERLSKDQLILESPIGIVDASIETQLSAIQDAFNRCFAKQNLK